MAHLMQRRHFVIAAGALLTAPNALAQRLGTIRRVGYLFSFVPSQGEHLWAACRTGLRELGYIEGSTILLEPRWANGKHERLPDLVKELVRLRVAVIVAAATPASLAAKAGAGRIPIVMVAVADPIKTGLAASLARPGGNITGLTLLTPELSGKRLELLVQVLGRVSRVAIMINPENSSHVVFADETLKAAQKMQIQLQSLRARNPIEVEQAFQDALKERAEALIVFDDPVIWSHRKQVVGSAATARLPVMYGYSEFVDEGGLISYGPQRPDLYRRTASYVDKILKGAKPAELPIEQPTRFELLVNLKTARTIGVKIPPSVMLRADRVIE